MEAEEFEKHRKKEQRASVIRIALTIAAGWGLAIALFVSLGTFNRAGNLEIAVKELQEVNNGLARNQELNQESLVQLAHGYDLNLCFVKFIVMPAKQRQELLNVEDIQQICNVTKEDAEFILSEEL